MLEPKAIPLIIREVGFDFSWDERKAWQLPYSAESVPVADLEWHLDVPFLWGKTGIYNLTPRAVLESPTQYPEEYARTLQSDLKYPIDIMENKGRWLILDGLHCLMKASIEGLMTVMVRKIPRSEIPTILKD